MNNLILFLLLALSSATCFANKERILTQVSFKDSTKFHRYTLIQIDKGSAFKLVFQENKNKPVVKIISKGEAEFIKNESTRIIWESLYRKPASTRHCSEYANISSGVEKAKVCTENKKATGMTYGLLNSMSQFF